MGGYEQFKEQLARLRQEAAQRDAAKRAAQQAKEEEVTRQRIENNWTLVKKKILDYLNEINVNVFSGQAKVTDWRTQTVEVAELSIPTVGSVFLFKLIGGYWNKKYRDGDQKESRGEIGTSDRVTIFQEVSCSGCRSTQEHSIPFPSLDPGWLALSDYYLGEGKPFEMFSKTHFKEEEDAYGATFSAVYKEITSLHEKL